jgi:CRISPR-associated exonuclease Cas4
MKLTGTIINYYFHCKRQCWLFAHRINLEDNSEDVRIGRIMHELKSEGKANTEIAIDSIKVDKLTGDYLVEMKKSDADPEAVRWQVLYYLKVLKSKGINKKGKIEFSEKNKQDNKIHYVDLTQDLEVEVDRLALQINNFLESDAPPAAERQAKCKRCAYFEYCFI